MNMARAGEMQDFIADLVSRWNAMIWGQVVVC